jgi:hypothetical protein
VLLVGVEPTAAPVVAPEQASPSVESPAYRAVTKAIDEELPATCAKVDAKYPLAQIEHDVVRRIQLARVQLTAYGVSEIEANERAHTAYADAIEYARAELRPRLAPIVDDVFLTQPRVTAALEALALDDHRDVYVYPERWAGYVAAARKQARTAARPALDRAASTCTDFVVERERGRWLAIFNGKL